MPHPNEPPNKDNPYNSLFHDLETRFQSSTLDPNKWYILTLACLVASPDPESASHLYTYLTNQARYTAPEARKALTRRLRETLIKSVPLVGVCKPIEAILSISRIENPEDKDYSFTRKNWQCDDANHQRGVDWFEKLYDGNAGDTLDLFSAHRDFAWLSTEITYGLYLSDRQVLDDLDTQLVVLPGIMCQNLRLETHWHIRGTRRLGVEKGDVEVICDCVRAVAAFFGMKLDKVPSVEDVESDV